MVSTLVTLLLVPVCYLVVEQMPAASGWLLTARGEAMPAKE